MISSKTEFDEDMLVSYSDILFEEEMLRTMMKASADYVVAVANRYKTFLPQPSYLTQ